MIAKAALAAAVARLRAAGIEEPARDARLLLAEAMGLAPDRLTLHLPDGLNAGQLAGFDAAITARAARKPVSKILGRRLFWGLEFTVTPDVLDPRPETETLVAEALAEPFTRMLDLGTGSGCILLSCLHGMPGATGVGADFMAATHQVVETNADRHGLLERIDICWVDWRDRGWWSPSSGRFDLVVSNPPYIAAGEMPGLSPEVRGWDPEIALTPGGDGLDAYRHILTEVPHILASGGRLLFEIGPTQGQAVAALVAAAGLQQIRILPDLDGRDRVVAARAA